MEALNFLRLQQQSDGGFIGYVSAASKPFKVTREQPTIFPTALILECLATVPGSVDIRDKAATYLQTQVSRQGSWNYWQKDSKSRILEPYPDDLDDTACALAALTHDEHVQSAELGKFARLLTAVEQQVGGPYNTWLIDTQQAPQWHQVDIAVNANIAYVLQLQKVAPAGLINYLEQTVQRRVFSSAYYVGELPVVYFLSRISNDVIATQLRSFIIDLLHNPPVSILHKALLLSAACNLGLLRRELRAVATVLQATTAWPSAAFYIDPTYNGMQHYGGSQVLTAALTVEALAKYESLHFRQNRTMLRTASDMVVPSVVRRDIATLPADSMRRQYVQTLQRVCKSAEGGQIMAAASLVASAGSYYRLSTRQLMHLNAASIHGWVAYTLYDDVLDGSDKLVQLTVANSAQRRSLYHFTEGAAQQLDFRKYVREVFDRMDAANDWELRYARARVVGSVLHIEQLPNYEDYTQLAEKSLGHSLAACGVIATQYQNMHHNQVSLMQQFFKYFLIARQLNDDAHDWEQDLRNGQLTSIVTLLLIDQDIPIHIDVDSEIERLRVHFWESILPKASTLISKHTGLARQALGGFEPLVDISVFNDWLQPLEASAQAAEHGRNEALEFMRAYKENHV